MRRLSEAQDLLREDKFLNPGWSKGLGSHAIMPGVPRLDFKRLSTLERVNLALPNQVDSYRSKTDMMIEKK